MGRSSNGESNLAAGLMAPGRHALRRGNFQGPLGQNRSPEAVAGPNGNTAVASPRMSNEDRQGAINARLLAAKAATGQGANINGTTNARSEAVVRPESSYIPSSNPMRGGK